MEQNDRIKLRLMGLSFSQLQNGAYALILAQVGGSARIPVVIGAPEAQSIAMKMEGIVPPRPMTHDIFASFTHAFGIKLREVLIYKFEDGIFYSELTFSQGDDVVRLDARTSDAVAIAIRTGAPIYTTPEVLNETAFEMDESQLGLRDDAGETYQEATNHEPSIEKYTVEELERTLSELIEKEDYEEAQRVKDLIEKKKNNQ